MLQQTFHHDIRQFLLLKDQGDRLGMTRAWIGLVIFSRPQNIPWVANRLRGLPLCPSVKALLWLGQWMMHISWMQCSIKATDSILRWVQGVLKGLHQLGCGICLLLRDVQKQGFSSGKCVLVLSRSWTLTANLLWGETYAIHHQQ